MLICPLCREPLTADAQGAGCSSGHRFDRARQGYYNVLPVQHKKSRDPGDNATMVQARRDFLNAGHYAPLAQRLAELVAERTPQNWMDIGCGEGYYTAQIAAHSPNSQGYALDISREAVKRACSHGGNVTWLVASMARLPLADASCDVLVSVFSPLDWNEARRVLKPSGALLRMGPTRKHLWALRERLYDEVRDYDDQKHLSLVPEGMHHDSTHFVAYPLTLPTPADRSNLLAMTPHGWRASAERRAAVIDHPLTVEVDIRYDWFVRDSQPFQEPSHAPA